MIIDMFGREIHEDEWTQWMSPQTFTLELTKRELETTIAALEFGHEWLLAQTIKLRGKAQQDACRASATVLAILCRAVRLLD